MNVVEAETLENCDLEFPALNKTINKVNRFKCWVFFSLNSKFNQKLRVFKNSSSGPSVHSSVKQFGPRWDIGTKIGQIPVKLVPSDNF